MKPFISVAKADIPIGQVFKIQSLLLDSNEYFFCSHEWSAIHQVPCIPFISNCFLLS